MGIRNFLKNGRAAIAGFEVSWRVRRSYNNKNRLASKHFLSPYKLHIGPGATWVKPSDHWVTVDIDPNRGDVVVDFHDFEEFPFEAETVDAIYASHTFEHISIYRIHKVVLECYRVLRPGGVIRIIVPNPQESIRQYLAGNLNFPLFKRRRERAKKIYGEDLTLFECLKGDFLSRNGQQSLLGERLAHQNAWDFEAMQAQLVRAGFDPEKIRRADFKDIGSSDFGFEGAYQSEANEYERSLYVEAIK